MEKQNCNGLKGLLDMSFLAYFAEHLSAAIA